MAASSSCCCALIKGDMGHEEGFISLWPLRARETIKKNSKTDKVLIREKLPKWSVNGLTWFSSCRAIHCMCKTIDLG